MQTLKVNPLRKFQVNPCIDNALWLAKLARPYPATAKQILEVAKRWKFSQSTLDFLRKFPSDEVFANMDDFLTRVEELELFMREEQDMPVEFLRSPQD